GSRQGARGGAARHRHGQTQGALRETHQARERGRTDSLSLPPQAPDRPYGEARGLQADAGWPGARGRPEAEVVSATLESTTVISILLRIERTAARAPLPLAGRGWGWGCHKLRSQSGYPPPHPSPARGEGDDSRRAFPAKQAGQFCRHERWPC